MSIHRENTPFDQPYRGASKVLKNELSKSLESIIYTFEHQKHDKTIMSEQLHLHESLFLSRAKEIGGNIDLHAKELMQASTDYANGHGKLEMIYECLELLRDELKR